MTLARAACYLGGMSKSAREREWAAEERPRERLYHKGAAALSDAELLAIQLGTGVPGLSVARSSTSLVAFLAGAALGGRLRVAMAGVSRRRWLLTFASTTSPRRIPAYGAGVARGLSLDG